MAGHVARTTPQLWSLEAWGGATYDVALRFLAEDPWERLAAAAPGRAQHLPADAAARPQHGRLHAVPDRGDRGLRPGGRGDRHRRLPHLRRAQRRRADAAGDRGRARHRHAPSPRSRSATPATCPTPTRRLYTLDYYLRLAERIVDAGAHVLAIKDMAGLLRAPAARTLVTALREEFDLPVHLHTHDTPGGQLATLLAAIDAGRRRGRRRLRLDGRHDLAAAAVGARLRDRPQPARDRPVAGARQRARALLGGHPPRLRALRVGPARPDRPRLPARDPRRPALQPAPAGDRARPRREVRAGRGHVCRGQRHPRQRRQGDALVQGRRRPRPAPRRRSAPTRASSRTTRAASTSPTRSSASSTASSATRPAAGPSPSAPRPWRAARGSSPPPTLTPEQSAGLAADRRGTLNELLFPGPTKDFRESRETYGDVSALPTLDYLYGLRRGEEHSVALGEGKRC